MNKVVFVACSLIGYLIGHYFGAGAIAVYSSIMISYHLYLVFLVVTSEKRTGLSLPIVQTILTHVACVGMVVLLAMGRHFIPFFGIVRLFIPAIAPFEADWLFSGGKKKVMLAIDPAPDAVAPVAAVLSVADPGLASSARASNAAAVAAPALAPSEIVAPAAVVASASAASVMPAARSFATTTGEEYEEFLTHLREGKRPFRKPGMTVRQEFDAWLGAKSKKHAASSGHAQSA